MTQENDNIVHEATTSEEVSIDNQVVQERPKRKAQLPKRLEDCELKHTKKRGGKRKA
jgi:hypothetical protein